MKIAITGHRPDKLGNDYDLKSPLILNIKLEIFKILWDRNPTYLISGMALGIDTLFAKMAIENNTKFIAAIPCANQEKKWTEKSKELYYKLIDHPLCEAIWVSTKEYTPYCMQKRNEWMIDICDLLIAVWDGSSGGTKNCIDYAIKKNKEIVYINPKLDVT